MKISLFEAIALDESGDHEQRLQALQIASRVASAHPTSMQAKILVGRIHTNLIIGVLDKLDKLDAIPLEDAEEQTEELMAELSTHCNKAIDVLEDAYDMESSDANEPATLAAG